MSRDVFRKLSRALEKIDRPGTFYVSGSAPAVLPGLEVEGLGPIGLPLTVTQAKELKKHCQQAPYGKGEETLVDTSVRRVWRMNPDQFSLANPEWEQFLQQTVRKVQEELGLEDQKLENHLHDLLLYEPGSFFLPHRDGEKLERMVATLVIVLPSSFQGGELVVRHDGQERVIDFREDANLFRIHFAAFYADCEHEIRPVREGYRLCLTYNLTLKKGKKTLAAPRSSEHVESVRQLLHEWANSDAARRLAVTLEHRYTQEGLTWDALKGVDRAKAHVLVEAARQTSCQASLALLTFHESGSAEYADSHYGRRRRWGDDEDDSSAYEMGEVFDSSLTADHWIDAQGQRLPLGEIPIDEDELLDPEALQAIEPEEEFEGYTGNEGMTLDRWYRHGAIFVWPDRRHFDVLCDAGSQRASEALKSLVDQWRGADSKSGKALRAGCIEFAAKIIARWRENPYAYGRIQQAGPDILLPSLAALDEPGLIKTYLHEVVAKDAAVDPNETLPKVCQQYGWDAFQPELKAVFDATTSQTLERNVRQLERICSANPRKKEGWIELCTALAQTLLPALERIDGEKTGFDYRSLGGDRGRVLADLAQALLATEQGELLSRAVDHALARPEKYPLTSTHVAALTALQPWLAKHVRKSYPGLSRWLNACCEQLESLTAETPQPPADFRRPAAILCKCADCAELNKFLGDPREQVHHFRVREDRRQHLQDNIRRSKCDLDLKTERSGSPHTLVCTKNTASYQDKLKTFHQDQAHLAVLRSIQTRLPK